MWWREGTTLGVYAKGREFKEYKAQTNLNFYLSVFYFLIYLPVA
jgi:hypothetical protein